MEAKFKTVGVEEFARLNPSEYKLIDLREPDAMLIGGIPGAVNGQHPIIRLIRR